MVERLFPVGSFVSFAHLKQNIWPDSSWAVNRDGGTDVVGRLNKFGDFTAIRFDFKQVRSREIDYRELELLELENEDIQYPFSY